MFSVLAESFIKSLNDFIEAQLFAKSLRFVNKTDKLVHMIAGITQRIESNNILMHALVLAIILACLPTYLQARENDADFQPLIRQLQVIANFNSWQSCDLTDDSEIISKFIESLANPDNAESATLADNSIDFYLLAFEPNGNSSSAAFRTLQLFGRSQFRALSKSQADQNKPFSTHVKEAIALNKDRSHYYAQFANGKTKSLSNLYISLEFALLPVAKFMDRWAKKYQKIGYPVLLNDFVCMTTTPAMTRPLQRYGSLNREGIKLFKTILRDYQKNGNAAAAKKDFAMVQFYAIKALSDLRHLEKGRNCNLSLSIHLIESAGLSARNAVKIGQMSNNKTDDFYRAFIILQNIGITGFSSIDLQAQQFHQAGIGIVTNDLPAIPFP